MSKGNLDQSIAGCLGLLIFLCLIVGGIWGYLSYKDNQDNRQELDAVSKYTANFNYNVDSLGKTINYYQPSDINSELSDTLNEYNSSVKGKVIVLYGEDHGIALSVNMNLNQKNVASRYEDLNTIVFVTFKEHKVGEYNSGVEAFQNYVIVDFWDKATDKLAARRIIWGDLPPQQVLRRQRTKGDIGGSIPDPKDIADVIDQQIANKKYY